MPRATEQVETKGKSPAPEDINFCHRDGMQPRLDDRPADFSVFLGKKSDGHNLISPNGSEHHRSVDEINFKHSFRVICRTDVKNLQAN